jgi:hypothetical protein
MNLIACKKDIHQFLFVSNSVKNLDILFKKTYALNFSYRHLFSYLKF